MSKIKKVAVIGAGAMGSGIAQVAASSGYEVNLFDLHEAALGKALQGIKGNLSKLEAKGKLSAQDVAACLGRLHITQEFVGAVQDADIVIEAALEDIQTKQNIFRQLCQHCKKEAILGTNTSSLSITEIASVTDRQGNVIGIHFMNPVPVMKGVEVIPGKLTDKKTIDASVEFVTSLAKEAILAVDYAGFIVSRLVDALFNEAARCIQDGNSPEEIDKAVKLCLNHPMGPCELMDLAGIDIVYNGLLTMERDFGDQYKPAKMLKQMVRAGTLGRKTGRGFYAY
ncbi:MAG: 3-hydroxyacyl-CoA dehydrogenase family protein [Sporomusaceae bacterium]|nr:3-hydroxyacyl-CoA dehydrogenase family protein [Sporomusaceae bacterium]